MLGKRSPQRELFRPDNALLAHVGEDTFYAFLAKEGPRLFRDEDFADLYGKRGRPSVPPSQMCVLLALQAMENVSDQESVDRTAYDLRWKVALGVELEEKLCAKSTLQLFRANLLLNERYLDLFETSVSACRRQGLGRSKQLEVAIDSTPVFGRGAVKDTYNLVSDAIRKVVKEACQLKGWEVDEVIAKQGLGRHFGSSFKGESDLDWSEREARRALLAQLVADARIALQLARKALRGYAKDSPKSRDLWELQDLLSRILAQDIDEEAEDGGGPQIRRGTARDRIVSTTDPEMRHGHKSESKGFEGYKASLVVDTSDGVIMATGVTPGNVSDGDNAAELIEAAGRAASSRIACVLGDTAYGGFDTRRQIESLGSEVVAKAPPLQSRPGTFKRDQFRVNEGRGEAKCPAGKRTKYRTKAPKGDGWVYVFSRNDCSPCPLRELCTTSRVRSRTITVTEESKELDRLRKHQRTKKFRRRYRKRVLVEHAFGRLRRLGVRQAKYFGAKKTAMQLAMAAMAANLSLLAVCPDFSCVVRVLLRWHATYTRSSHRPKAALQLALCRPHF